MLLEMLDITKAFAGGPVLHGVSFGLERGQIHALVGHNGAGKSTLMKVLGGLYPDHGGTIRINGEDVRLTSPHHAHEHGIATIYQDFALVPNFTVAENIALGREPGGAFPGLLSHGALRRRSQSDASAVGIELPMNVPVHKLGVADQQLTEIVRALSRQPGILIMDEPTARLAPAEREQLFSIMRRMAASGMGIIYISHFLDEVVDIAHRITVLRDGSVVSSGASDSFSVDGLAKLLIGVSETPKASGQETGSAMGFRRRARLRLKDFSVSGRRPFDLDADAGEIVGLAGLIGSGRSRIARALIGDAQSRGSITLDDQELRRLNPVRAARLGIVLVPEDRKTNGLVLTGSIRANIELTALETMLSRFGLVRREKRRRKVADAIRRFHIRPPDGERNVATLSGGNAQKVLLARAALAAPRLLVLDQPTAGVDVGAKAELHNQIRGLAAEGSTILLISDDLDELLCLCDRIAIVNTGTVGEVVEPRNIDRVQLLATISRNSQRAPGAVAP